jgi:general secretion pathway protein G
VNHRAFTIIELLVVIGIIAILASLLFPVLSAQMERARIDEARSQLEIFRAALELYSGPDAFGDFPPSSWAGAGDNAGAERMLDCLRTSERGGPFIKQRTIRPWLGDTDDDGREELLDPWGNPWIYFHNSDYPGGAVYYVIDMSRRTVSPVKRGDVYVNPTSYQLRAAGPNKSDESGEGDDIGTAAP